MAISCFLFLWEEPGAPGSPQEGQPVFLRGFRFPNRHKPRPHQVFLRGFRSPKRHKLMPNQCFYVVFATPRGTNPYHTRFLTWFSAPQEAETHAKPVFFCCFRVPKRHKAMPNQCFYVVFGFLTGTNPYQTMFFYVVFGPPRGRNACQTCVCSVVSCPQEAQSHAKPVFLRGLQSLKRHKPIPHHVCYVVFGYPRGTNPYQIRFFTWFSRPQEAQTHTTPGFCSWFSPPPKRHKAMPNPCFCLVFDFLRGTNPYQTRFFKWFGTPKRHKPMPNQCFYMVFAPPRGTHPYHTCFFTWLSAPQEAQSHAKPVFLRGVRSLKRHKPIPDQVFYVVFGLLRGTNPLRTMFFTWFSVPQEAETHAKPVFLRGIRSLKRHKPIPDHVFLRGFRSPKRQKRMPNLCLFSGFVPPRGTKPCQTSVFTWFAVS